MRLIVYVLALVSMLLAATSATAVLSFDVIHTSVSTGHALDALEFGDEVTIDIRMSNPTGATIYAVGAGIQSWDEGVATFVSGDLNLGPYFCASAPCLDGLRNSESIINPGNESIRVIPEFAGYPALGNYISLVQAYSLSGFAGDGTVDPGLDGIDSGGDAQFRVVFRAIGAPGAQTILNIGSNPNPIVGNVVVLTSGATALGNNANLTLTMIPEPGMALLMGVGLAGLAGRRRRDSARISPRESRSQT